MALDCEMEEHECGERVDRLGAEPRQGFGERIEELGRGRPRTELWLLALSFHQSERGVSLLPLQIKVSPATDLQSLGKKG